MATGSGSSVNLSPVLLHQIVFSVTGKKEREEKKKTKKKKDRGEPQPNQTLPMPNPHLFTRSALPCLIFHLLLNIV